MLRLRSRFARVLAAISTLLACAAASADGPLLPVRAEIAPVNLLNSPDHPIWLRFTLRNPSDQSVDIPFSQPGDPADGVTLPRGLILGRAEEPGLFLAFEDELLKPYVPPAGTADVLRLAPRSVLGGEVDLRALFPNLRYPGIYKLEWRPLGGLIPVATLQLRIDPRKDAILVTDYGKITFSLKYDLTPLNVANFLELVTSGFYDGKTIHRIIPGFLLQGGSPTGDDKGVRPDGKTVPSEFHNGAFDIGSLAMAIKRSGDPDSASCQFLIGLGRSPELDGKYTIFGEARDAESLRTLQQLASLHTNANGRPVQPLVIRSINLVNAGAINAPAVMPTTQPAEPELPSGAHSSADPH